MKILKKSLLLILCVPFIFTACESTETESQVTTQEAPLVEKEEKIVEQKKDVKKEEKVEKEPANVIFATELQAFLEEGDIKAAIKHFESIPSEIKSDPELKILLASLHISDGNYEKSMEIANQILESDPDNVDALEVISLSSKASGDKATYKKIANQILEEDPYNVQANLMIGDEYALNKKYKLALNSYKKVLKAEANNIDALYGCARMYYFLDDLDASREMCETLIEKEPKNPAGLAFMGKLAAEDNNYVKAIKYTQDALNIDKENYTYYMDLGFYCRQCGKYQEAIDAWNKAVEIDDTYFLAYAYLAGIYDELEKFNLALENYHKVIETNPKYFYAYESTAILEYHLGNYAEAQRLFDIAYSYSKNYSYKLMNAAMYFKMGDSINGKKVVTDLLKTLDRESTEYSLVRLYADTYSRNAETTLVGKINKEDDRNKKGKMLFYLGLYYEIFDMQEMAFEYYSKVTKMQAPMFFEYRLAEWSLGL